MFDEEREALDNLFKYFESKFKEEVGIMAGVVEEEEFELDLIVGMDSDLVRGIRLLQFLPSEDGEAVNEDGEDLYDVIVYDFVASEASTAPDGDVLFEVKIAAPGCHDKDGEACCDDGGGDDSFWIKVTVFVKEDEEGAELTGILMTYLASGETIRFVEDPSL